MREQGVAGFVMSAGVVQSRETNHKLLGTNRWRTAADMLSNVSIIAAGLRYTLNLTARPKWKADPVNDTAEAKAAAEFVDDIIENMDRSWSRVIRASAMYRFHGFQINEWVASKRDDGKIGIQTVEARPQHTIERWDIDPNGGVQGVWQRDPQTSKELYLPRKKIVYLVDDSFTDRPDGIGVFRHLVEDWNQLKVYMRLERLGFQRDLTGIPIGRVPLAVMNKLVQDGKITAAQRDQMIEGIRDFVSLETKSDTTGLLLDSAAYTAKGDTGETISSVMQWGIDLITGEQNSIESLGAAIKRTQFDMALVMGTSSLLTGREGEGSRALSEDQSRNLYLTVNQSLNDMAEAYDRDIIGPIWAMNGMDEKLRPKLTHEDASFKDVEQIAATLQKMAAAGAILAPDDPAINDLRNLMGISEAEEMSVEDLALIRGAGKTPPGQEGGGAPGGKPPGGKPGGDKPANSNEPNDATTGAPQRRGAAQKWDGWVEKYNPHHVPSGEHGGEFTSATGGGNMGVTVEPYKPLHPAHEGYTHRVMVDGKQVDVATSQEEADKIAERHRVSRRAQQQSAPVTIPRKFQPRNFAELKDHPAVDSIDDYRPDGMHVNLATGFAWSEQHSFGVETVGQALRLMREVYWEGDGPPPWADKALRLSGFDESKHPRDEIGRWTTVAATETFANPLVNHERLIADATNQKIGGVTIRDFDGGWHISDLRSITRGGGREALQRVTELADENGKRLTLNAVPLDSPAGLKMSKPKLRAWYGQFGFESDGKGDAMAREPKPVQKFNPYHKPAGPGGGQFTSATGGGGGPAPWSPDVKAQIHAANRGKTLDQMHAEATVNQQALEQLGNDLEDATGIEFDPPPPGFEVKTKSSIIRKINDEGYEGPHQITDMSRASFVVNSPQEAEKVVQALQERGTVYDKGWAKIEKWGYIDRKVYLQHPNGGVSEVQITPRGIYQIKDPRRGGQGHVLYEVGRKASTPMTVARAAMRKSRRLYGRAIRRTDSWVTQLRVMSL